MIDMEPESAVPQTEPVPEILESSSALVEDGTVEEENETLEFTNLALAQSINSNSGVKIANAHLQESMVSISGVTLNESLKDSESTPTLEEDSVKIKDKGKQEVVEDSIELEVTDSIDLVEFTSLAAQPENPTGDSTEELPGGDGMDDFPTIDDFAPPKEERVDPKAASKAPAPDVSISAVDFKMLSSSGPSPDDATSPGEEKSQAEEPHADEPTKSPPPTSLQAKLMARKETSQAEGPHADESTKSPPPTSLQAKLMARKAQASQQKLKKASPPPVHPPADPSITTTPLPHHPPHHHNPEFLEPPTPELPTLGEKEHQVEDHEEEVSPLPVEEKGPVVNTNITTTAVTTAGAKVAEKISHLAADEEEDPPHAASASDPLPPPPPPPAAAAGDDDDDNEGLRGVLERKVSESGSSSAPAHMRFPDLTEKDTNEVVPVALTEEEQGDVIGDLLGLGGDLSDADSSVPSEDEDELELGDGVVVPQRQPKPPTRRGRGKAVVEDEPQDEWADVPTNEVIPAAAPKETNTSGPSASSASSTLMPKPEGQAEIGSAKADTGEMDDEFDYAFDGQQRVGKTHLKTFVPKAAPSHLITNLKSQQLGAFAEEDEEEEEEEEEEQEVEGPAGKKKSLDLEEDASIEVVEAVRNKRPQTTAAPPSSQGGATTTTTTSTTTTSAAAAGSLKVEGQQGGNGSSSGATTGMGGGGGGGDLASEWERVTDMRQGDVQAAAANQGKVTPAMPPVSWGEVLRWIESVDISDYLHSIVVDESDQMGFFAKMFKCFGPPQLTGVLVGKRERVFSMAKISFSEDDPMHFRILQSIYKRFTGSSGTVARYGNHWEDVGFQGADPATDLRACGVLGLVQLLHLHTQNSKTAQQIYNLSRDPVQEFPLAPLSMNISMLTLHALRKGLLSKEIKARNDVLSVANSFYVGGYIEFYNRWKKGGKTMKDSGFVKKDLEKYMLNGSNTSKVLAQSKQTLGSGEPLEISPIGANEKESFLDM